MREKIGTTSVEKEPEIPFEQIIEKLESMYSVEIPEKGIGKFRKLCAEIWEKKVWVGRQKENSRTRQELRNDFCVAGFSRFLDNQTISVCGIIFSSGKPPDSSSAEEEGRREVRALRAEAFHGGK